MTESQAIQAAKKIARNTGKPINIVYDCDYYGGENPAYSFFTATDHEADTIFAGCRISGVVEPDGTAIQSP